MDDTDLQNVGRRAVELTVDKTLHVAWEHDHWLVKGTVQPKAADVWPDGREIDTRHTDLFHALTRFLVEALSATS